MKRLFNILTLVLFIPLFSSCDLYCIWLISELDGIGCGWDDGVDQYLCFDKDGDEDFVTVKKEYKFYMIEVQGDTIYWYGHDSYKQKSIENGYTFESNNRYISGDGLALDATFDSKFMVELTRNPYRYFRHMDVFVVPSHFKTGDSFGGMKYYVITQDYYDEEIED